MRKAFFYWATKKFCGIVIGPHPARTGRVDPLQSYNQKTRRFETVGFCVGLGFFDFFDKNDFEKNAGLQAEEKQKIFAHEILECQKLFSRWINSGAV